MQILRCAQDDLILLLSRFFSKMCDIAHASFAGINRLRLMLEYKYEETKIDKPLITRYSWEIVQWRFDHT